jgi:hypothetical protein
MNTITIRILGFVIYTILYKSLIWIGFGYVVFVLGYSGWWLLLAAMLSGGQYKPWHFGICKKPVDET